VRNWSTGTPVLKDRTQHVIDSFSTKRSILAAWIAVAVYLLGFAVSALIRSQSDFYIYRNADLRTCVWRITDFRHNQQFATHTLWGAPRIHGELLKLGIEISQATVAKYMLRRRGRPSPTWRSFLRNQAAGIAAIDMFVVASASFRLLYVMILLAHDRRKIVRFDVTRHPTAGWLSRQLTEAFPWDTAPRYLLRDRDTSYGSEFCNRVEAMGIEEVIAAPRSPLAERIRRARHRSIRRECLDHIVIFNERHLRRVLSSYVDYYHGTRTHLSLDKDCPDSRPIQHRSVGRVVAIPKVGGLHHRYERLAA
jgi:putative transposase